MTTMGGGAAHCVKMEDMREMEGVHLRWGDKHPLHTMVALEETPSAHSGNLVEETPSARYGNLVEAYSELRWSSLRK